MRVLIVSHFFPPRRIGGAEKIAQVYAASLLERGYGVQVLCAGEWQQGPRHYNGYEDEIYQGIPVRRVNLNWARAEDPNRALYDNRALEPLIEQWLEAWKPDVVHIVSLMTMSACIVRAAKKRGIPVVFTMVDFWLICPKVNLVRGDQSLCDGKVSSQACLECLLWNTNTFRGLKRILPRAAAGQVLRAASRAPWLNRARGLRGMALDVDDRRRVMAEITRQADCIIAPSTFLRNVTQGAGLFSQPVRLIHYGHDLSWVRDMPERIPAPETRIGFIGQIISLKGLHILIPAFLAAASRGNARLLIYGDPRSDPAYTARLQELMGDSQNITFMGPYAHSEIGAVLAGLDVIAVPSQWHENNPLVVQEAFASGTPVIGSDVGGISEFIRHGENGLLFEHSSIPALQAQIERVVCEPGLVDRLRGGIGPVKEIASEMDEIVEIYQGLVH